MTEGGRSGGRIGAAVREMSLRARLLIVLGVVSAFGLLAADLATYAALRSSLFDRVDSSLDRHPDRQITPSACSASSSLSMRGRW